MDLGACPKSHTERLKTEFLAARTTNPGDPTFARFQKEYEANIFQFVDECDRRIRAAHRRLEKTPEENAKTTNLVSVYPVPVTRHGGKVKIGDGSHQASRRPISLGVSKTLFAVALPSRLSPLLVLFRLRFGNYDANRTLTRIPHNPVDARDCGNRIGNSGRNRKDRGLWSVPFPFALPLTFQQRETPSCLLDDY